MLIYMDLTKEKSTKDYQHGKVILFILVIIFCFALITSVSATDNTNSTEVGLSSSSNTYNVNSSLNTEEIQKVFDGAKSGDTINFTSKNYNNFSVVVDKKLNIISDSNSVLNTNSQLSTKAKSLGLGNSFGFYFTNSSSGCLLRGFTLNGNADYQIIVNGANNINIRNNTINGGREGGVLIENSTGSNLTGNKIMNSGRNGLDLYDTKDTIVKNNNISKNTRDGVYIHNADKLNLTYNDMLSNGRAGLDMEGSTSNCNFIHNHIQDNANNILINSRSHNDVIRENTITGAKYSSVYDDGSGNTGNGILFGDDYKSAGIRIYIGYNTIGFNSQFDAKNTMTQPVFTLGANYYITNDGEQAKAHLCPMLMGGELNWEKIKHLSLGFSKKGNQVYGLLYDDNGNVVTAGDFDMDDVSINGQSYGKASYVDGKAVIDADVDDGSEITVKSGSSTTTVIVKKSSENTDSTNTKKDDQSNTNPNNPNNSNNPSNSNNQGTGTSNQTGTGSGNGQGSGSGTNSNLNGTGIMSGESSGVSNGGSGQSGDNGAGSSSSSSGSADNGKAYEIATQKTSAGSAAQNRQWLAVAAIVALVLLFVVGYKRRNNDDDFD